MLAVCFLTLITKAQCPITVTGNTVICQGTGTSLTANSTATSYTWNPGGINGSVANLNPLTTTTYTVIGTNGGCTDSTTVTLIVNPLPNITINANTMAICSGNCSVLSGSGGMSYTWSPNAGSMTSSSTTVCPTSATNYTLTGSMSGCENTATITIGVTASPTVSVSAFPSYSVCAGNSTTLIASGATNYTWIPSGANTPTLNISPNTTSVYTVCGANGTCLVCVPVTITVYSLTPFISVINAACGQNNGSISIDSVPGSTPPLTYSLNAVNQGTNASYSNLLAGNYSVTLTDNAGCTGNTIIPVNNSNFTAQLNPTQPTCNLCDGIISTTIIGGTGPYTYTWSNGASTSSINNLCTGNYQVSVTDNFGCFTASTINIVSPSAPLVLFDSIVNVNCDGVTTGLARVSVTGGTGPYTYSWSTTPTQTTNIASGLPVGNYTVTVTDNVGCSSSRAIYISNVNSIYAYATTNNVNCSTSGSATIHAVGGTAPYTYSWSNSSASQTATNLPSGPYTFTITDINGCTGNGSVTIYTSCMNFIKGRVYDDANQNCIQDVGEVGLANRTVIATPGPGYGFTNNLGDYVVFTPNMTNTVSLSLYNNFPYYTPTCPPTATLSAAFSQLGDTLLNNDFGFYANPNYFDLSISVSWNGGNPGFPKIYYINYFNNSPTNQNILVRFTYDPTLQFDSCNLLGIHYPAQHKIEWTVNNVPANSWSNYLSRLRANMKIPVSTPLTTILQSTFEILPISGDANPANNTITSHDPVTGSHDPNAKSVWPPNIITQNDSILTYKIHFQNNGNDTAYRVVVVDTLSPFVDPATIIPGGASHPYTFNLSGKGICTWTFDSIMLPDSLTNEPASNGYFNYTIKQKPGNPVGTYINNTAYIYFDFASAVVTNTTMNQVVVINVPETILNNINNSFVIYPNPASDYLVMRYTINNTGPVNIEVRNILGELVKSQTVYNKQKGINTDELSTNGLTNGVYIIRILNGTQQQAQKLIIQK